MSKQYLIIQSKGEIESYAFTLMGGTTKRGDSKKIGMYGSGLKYAISSLLRNNIHFTVYSGTRKLQFETERTDFRDNSFDIITINGKETNLTTNMGGSDWDNAFAPIREIYSNALDEDSNAKLITGSRGDFLKDGYTTFYIELTHDVAKFFAERHLYFLQQNSSVLFANEFGSIYSNPNINETRLFRKGILCFKDENLKAQYLYNSPLIDINESRVVSNKYQADKMLMFAWKRCNSSQTILTFLTQINGTNAGSYEAKMYWDWNYYGDEDASFSDEWGEVCDAVKFVALEHVDMFEQDEMKGRYRIKLELLKKLLDQFKERVDVLGMSSDNKNDDARVERKPSQALLDKVLDAITQLQKTNYDSRFEKLTIKYCAFEDKHVSGQAEKGVIWLSIKLEDYAVDQIAMIIIEENEHNKTGHADQTRAFQTHLFRLYFNQLILNSK